jgi:uncharacterized protein YraI
MLIGLVAIAGFTLANKPIAMISEGQQGRRLIDSYSDTGGKPVGYVIGAKWEKNPVTYSFLNCPSALDCEAAKQVVREAIEKWDSVCGLALDEIGADGDIRIGWFKGSHGDGEPFDGPGDVLAHAFFPLSWLGAIAGDLHFDDSEAWVIAGSGSSHQVDLRTVALHETGHSLGLDHSQDPNAVMWEEYTGLKDLTGDDIGGVQELYGPPGENEGSAPVPPPTTSNVTARATTTARLRSGPGTGHTTLGSIPAGTTVPVLGKNVAGDWMYVEYNGVRGWTAKFLFVLNGDFNTVPVVDQNGNGAPPAGPTPVPGPQPTPSGVSATSTTTVRIRLGPATTYPTQGNIPIGTTVAVLGKTADGTWIYVSHSGIQGWAATWLFTINGDLNQVPIIQ